MPHPREALTAWAPQGVKKRSRRERRIMPTRNLIAVDKKLKASVGGGLDATPRNVATHGFSPISKALGRKTVLL
jgi:hypothetical protein